MTRDDASEFEGILSRAYERLGKALPSPELIAEWFDDFADWSLEQFRWAMEQHRKTSRYLPQPADLFEIARSASGQLSASEAWSVALDSLDESKTVMITEEILTALSVARPVLEMNTPAQARQAFEAAYNREMLKAPIRPKWEISLGHDLAQREEVVLDARKKGLISETKARHLLPELGIDRAEVAGLLPNNVVQISPEKTRKANIQRLRKTLADAQKKSEQKRQRKELERIAKGAQFASRKADAIEALEEKISDDGAA